MSRLGEVLTALNASSEGGSLVGGICQTTVELLKVEGSGLALQSKGRSGQVCVFGRFADTGEELQFTLGEGPCKEVFAGESIVEAPDLSTDTRWPMFSSAMTEAGVGSVASFPVRIGGAQIGALTTYRMSLGSLSLEQASYGYVIAEVAAHVIGAAQAKVDNEQVIQEMEAGQVRMGPVHQATGMIMGQLRIGAEDALARLRSAAYSSGRSIIELSGDVIAGRRDFAEDA